MHRMLLLLALILSGTATAAPPVVTEFVLDGSHWTCQADGKPLAGILLKPEGKGPHPAVIISHGLGGNAEGYALPKAREMVKWGLVCIGPDYTHAGRGGGDRSTFGASTENLRRARACVEILRSLGYVDMKRVAACGNSMGAFLTIGLAAASPDAILCAAITAGGVAPVPGSPAPPVEMARKIRAPFLILHGSADSTVPPERSLLLKQTLDAAKTPNRREVFEGVNHDLHQVRSDECFKLTREWFKQHGVLKS